MHIPGDNEQSKYYSETKPPIAECANLQLSASEASGQYSEPWDSVVRAKNSCRHLENLQLCGAWVPLYDEVKTHFISKYR